MIKKHESDIIQQLLPVRPKISAFAELSNKRKISITISFFV